MEYKRLTKFIKGVPAIKTYTGSYMTPFDSDVYDAIKRLAELEDKIEQGTLIELPCKVGDTIYIPWVYDDKFGVSFHQITRIEIYKNSIDLCFDVDTDIYYIWIYIYSQGRFSISELGNRFFLTREEAEKRLKELQK